MHFAPFQLQKRAYLWFVAGKTYSGVAVFDVFSYFLSGSAGARRKPNSFTTNFLGGYG